MVSYCSIPESRNILKNLHSGENFLSQQHDSYPDDFYPCSRIEQRRRCAISTPVAWTSTSFTGELCEVCASRVCTVALSSRVELGPPTFRFSSASLLRRRMQIFCLSFPSHVLSICVASKFQ